MAVVSRWNFGAQAASSRNIEGASRAQLVFPLPLQPRSIEGVARFNVAPIYVADTLPPVLDSAWAPAAGTVLRAQAIVLPLKDTQIPQSNVAAVTIWAEYGDGLDEVIFESGTGFHANFVGLSSISSGALGTQHVAFTLARSGGGWRNATTVLKTYAVDQQGNSATYSSAYAVSDAPAGPTLDTDFAPTSGSTILKTAVVSVPLIDTAFNLASLVVFATYGDGSSDIIYDGGSFASAYSTSGLTGGIGTPNASFALRRNSGWKNAATSIHVLTSDANGLSASFAASYTVTDPPPGPDSVAPVVTDISPTAGTPIARAAPVFFSVTDAAGNLHRAMVLAKFADGTYEVVHDGDAFAAGYLALSTRTVITNGFRFRVRRGLGWLNGGPEIVIVSYDLAGNET